MSGNETARRQLDALTAEYGKPPRLGCELSAHRDLGLCAYCIRTTTPYEEPLAVEVVAWRLLAMAERGVPPQTWEASSDE